MILPDIRYAAALLATVAGGASPWVSATESRRTTLKMLPDRGKVEFQAIGRPSFLKVHGIGEGARGEFGANDRKVSGFATFRLDSLDTGIELRNEHMKKKYLQTDLFPVAKLSINELEVPEALFSGTDAVVAAVPFRGTLSLHGVEKTVEGKASWDRKADVGSLTCDFAIALSDFKIDKPGYAGITLADTVNVTVTSTVAIPAAHP